MTVLSYNNQSEMLQLQLQDTRYGSTLERAAANPYPAGTAAAEPCFC